MTNFNPREADVQLVARALAPEFPGAGDDLLYREDATRVLRAIASRDGGGAAKQPHEAHDDAFEDAHMTAAGAIVGARMAGKNIPQWTADMNEAFRVAVAEAFDAGFRAGQEATP